MVSKIQEEYKRLASVPTNGDEYKRVAYSLKLYSRVASITIKDMRRISAQSIEFNKLAKDKTQLECWIQISPNPQGAQGRIQDPPNLDHIIQHGFSIPEGGGLRFPVGVIFLWGREIEEEAEYTFILTRVIVGRSLCLSKNAKDVPTSKANIPDSAYDSVCIFDEHDDLTDEDQIEIQRPYRHEYLIYDQNQIMPTYVVTCTISSDTHLDRDMVMCCKCGDHPAEKWCLEDQAPFCPECDKDFHDNLQDYRDILTKHNRVMITEKPESFGSCTDHETKKVEFFCQTCQVPLCVYCKMLGSHASGDYANHGIIAIENAYSNAINDAHSEDPELKKQKGHIANQLKRIEDKLKEINKRYKSVEEKIYEELKEVLAHLDAEIHKKIYILLSDRHELERQKEEIEHAETFLASHIDKLNPIDFINLWIDHNQLKKKLRSMKMTLTEIQTDIRLEGKLQIVSDQHYKMLQVTTDQGKSSQFQTERARGEEHSTIFRHGIFKKMAEKKIANNQGVDIFGGASYNVGGNVPVQQRLETKGIMEEQKMGGELHSTKKLTGDLQKIVQAVDEKMSQQGFKGSVSVECFKRSVYGRFSDTYKLLRDTIVQDDLMTTLIPYVFKGSRILANNCEGIVLYFNLPLKENWFPKPKRIFPVEKDLGSQTVKDLLIFFEKSEYNTPNIILLKNDKSDEIFGGYASDLWSVNKKRSGSETCFLFNLTKNIRFDARKGKDAYMFCPDDHTISFGDTDLVLRDNFVGCSSEVESYFSCGSNIYKELRPENVLAGHKELKIGKIEVWCLKS